MVNKVQVFEKESLLDILLPRQKIKEKINGNYFSRPMPFLARPIFFSKIPLVRIIESEPD